MRQSDGSHTGGTDLLSRALMRCPPDISMIRANTLEELQAIDSRFRSEKPKIFELAESDPPATAGQLNAIEKSVGVKLPTSFRRFLATFGGGTVGLTVVFSAFSEGESYLPDGQHEAARFMPPGLLAFSDDFAGGYYVFRVNDGVAEEAPWYWNQDGSLSQTEFANIFGFVARYAYEPA